MNEQEVIKIIDETSCKQRNCNKCDQYRKELEKYRAIGMVEECREAREKQIEKKPEYYGDSEDGKIICPSCDIDLWEYKECGFNCCPECGQRIDWSVEVG